jgi:HK97 family phage major capsid protein
MEAEMPFAPAETRASAWSADDYQTRFAELRSELADALSADDDQHRASYASLHGEVDQLDTEFRLVLLQTERETRQSWLGTTNPAALNAALLQMSAEETRSWGQQVVENEDFRAWLGANAGREHVTGPSPMVELRTLVTEAAGSASGANYLLPVGQPFLPTQAVNRQRLFIRDLIATGTTGLAAIPYVRELNAVANQSSASTVAEGAVKPEGAVQFVGDLAATSVIAVNIPVTTQIMEDAPTVMSYINGRLVYMLKLREENEILTGNGTPPDLKGIRNFPGLQTQAATAGEFAITLGNAMAKIELVNGTADGVAMNPADAWSMLMKRASTSGVFDVGTPFSASPHTVWGVPVVRTLSMPQGKALVGDYSLGAQLFDRKAASVNAYEQHSDFAARNQVLLQAEERVALAVYRPDWYCEATLA